MSKRPQLPGDPSDLYLRIFYDDELWDTPQADTMERWSVSVLHRWRGVDDVLPGAPRPRPKCVLGYGARVGGAVRDRPGPPRSRDGLLHQRGQRAA
ncbi:hypothetical protein SCAB_21941 [Streptomyces scabiei 87.22]|uniref:Uncharacterized protein n=1 Tax=Streptomyces scabiei (strain 87.22) TaxID=680198 RepID=C9YXF6_STRSW|nr:hypothetical protein SCAB_21941 [Streptomyces scabiei 87.22]